MFSFKRIIAALFVITSIAIVVFSQANGKVNGTVTDPNGAGVPGAVVKLQSQATKIEIETTTNDSGYFNFVNLNPTVYVLRVEVQGFKGVQTPPFDVGVSEAVTRNISLTIGQVSETVETARLLNLFSNHLQTWERLSRRRSFRTCL
jgi:hypothetical protein